MNTFYIVTFIIVILLGCLFLYGARQDKLKAIEKLNKVKERLDYNFVQLMKYQRDTNKFKTYIDIVEECISIIQLSDCTIGVELDILDRSGFVEIMMKYKDIKACYYFIPPYSGELKDEITEHRKSLWRNEVDLILRYAQEDLVQTVSQAQITKGTHLCRDDLRDILKTLTEKQRHVLFVDFKISYDCVMIRTHLKSDYSKTVEQVIPVRN